jgi:uncharacterized protein YciI
MEFDTFTLLLLVRPADAPDLPDDELDRLQDAHLAHLASLHDTGKLAAAGPLVGDDEPVRGICIFTVGPDEAAALMADDPSVRAGRLETQARTWLCPAGAMSFSPTRFPRSVADVRG